MAGRRSNAVSATQTKPLVPASEDQGKSQGLAARNKNNKDFDPKLIFSQIVAIQSFHYLFLGFIFQVNHVIFNTTVTIDRLFTGKYLNLWSMKGWADNAAILLSYLFGAMLLNVIVEKSKKCLDFSVTLFVIHLVSCIWYAGIPNNWDWWIVHILGTIVMILLGEYLCSLRELSEIPLLELPI